MDQLRGRTALLTGAAGGLGAYIARALAAEGVDLVLSDLPSTDLGPIAGELTGQGVRVEQVPCDLSDPAERGRLVAKAEEAIGPIDILVNNAGLEFGGTFLEAKPEEIELIAAVNLTAVMELTRQALPGMLERRRGHVVNIASMAGKLASPYLATYCATKHGVVGFSHSLRSELGSRPVGVSAICPIFITRVGMYGRVEHLVPDPPPEMATMPPEAVGEAVVRAIRENRAEIKVTKGPAGALVGLYAAAPGLFATFLNRRKPLRDFARRFAEAREGLDPPA